MWYHQIICHHLPPIPLAESSEAELMQIVQLVSTKLVNSKEMTKENQSWRIHLLWQTWLFHCSLPHLF